MAEQQLQTLYRRYAENGDLAALGALFDAAAPDLLHVARRLARSPEAAEDAVQEVFLTIVEQPESYDPARPLGPWLLGVLVHRIRSGRRRDARSPEPDRLEAREEPEPIDVLRGAELEESVRAAVRSLPENERVAVAARLFEGVGGRELAQRLGISAGAARIRLHRGLSKLRAIVPAGLAAALVGGGAEARALSAMRGRVLEAAGGAGTAKAAGAGGSAWKAWAFAAGLLAVSVGVWAVARTPNTSREGTTTDLARREDELAQTPDDTAPVEAASTRAAIDPQPDTAEATRDSYRVRVVHAADGAAVEGVRLTLSRYIATNEYEESPAARSDAEGRATLPVPDDWSVRRVVAWPTDTTGWSLEFLHTKTDEERAKEITLELAGGGTFEGRVVDVDGRPVPGAKVRGWCSPRIEGPPVRVATSGADGAFRIEHLGPRFYVDAQMDGYAIRSGFDGELAAGETAEGLEIVLARAATLQGVVTDLDGRALEGVRIWSKPHYGTTAQWKATPYVGIWKTTGLDARTTSDASGAFEVSPVPSGNSTRLHFRRAPFHEKYADLDPKEGPHEIRLDPGLSVEGVVLGADGTPAAGARVRGGPYFGNRQTTPASVVTDASGRFRLDGFTRPDPTDEYEAPPYLVVTHAGHAVHVEQPVNLGPDAVDVSIRLDAELRLAGRVVDPAGAPFAGASLRIIGERRMNRGYGSTYPPSWVHMAGVDGETSDKDGRFAFDHLPAGRYELQLFAPGDRLRSRSFEVEAGAEDLELVLDEGAMAKVVLKGRVTDARTGEPIDRFRVCPITDDGGMNREIEDPDGRYEVSGLDPARYSVAFQADGYSRYESASSDYAEGTHTVDAALWPEASLRFVIVDEKGELLPGAVLRAYDLDDEPLTIGTKRSRRSELQAYEGRGIAHGLPARPITVEVEWRGDSARHAVDLTNPIEHEVELGLTKIPEPVIGRVELLVVADDAEPAELRREFEEIRTARDMDGMARFMGGLLERSPSRKVTLLFTSATHRRRLSTTVEPLPSGQFEITKKETDGLSGSAGPSLSSESSSTIPVPSVSVRLPVGVWSVDVLIDGESALIRSIEVPAPDLDAAAPDPTDPWANIPDVMFFPVPR